MQRQRFIDLEWVVYLRRAVRDVRQDRDNAYHIEAFYRYRLNDNIYSWFLGDSQPGKRQQK